MAYDVERSNLWDFAELSVAWMADLIAGHPAFIRVPLLPQSLAKVQGRMGRVRGQIFSAPDAALEDAGLTNPELQMKLGGFHAAFNRIVGLAPFAIPSDLLEKVLEWLNTILGSLAAVVPAAEGIRELKEVLERHLDP